MSVNEVADSYATIIANMCADGQGLQPLQWRPSALKSYFGNGHIAAIKSWRPNARDCRDLQPAPHCLDWMAGVLPAKT